MVGGHVALDLVNTVEPRVPDRSVGQEHLGTAEALLAWSRRVGVVTDEEGERVARGVGRVDVGRSRPDRRARDPRGDLRRADRGAGSEPARRRLERSTVLQRHWSAAISRATLTLTADTATSDRLHVGNDPALLIPDRLAHAAVDLVRTLEVDHLKTCPLEDGGCGWLFLDRSRNSSRRWCSMDDCGAKAKARRLTARRRQARSS